MVDDGHRHVTIRRLDTGVYRAINASGRELRFGSMDESGFSPVELLLTAIAGCSAVDVDVVTGRRAEPEHFEVTVEATKVSDEDGNRLEDIRMTFRLAFPDDEAGERAWARVPGAVRASHDRTCTVTRTVEAGTPVTVAVEDVADSDG